jgi:hypothetical protein
MRFSVYNLILILVRQNIHMTLKSNPAYIKSFFGGRLAYFYGINVLNTKSYFCAFFGLSASFYYKTEVYVRVVAVIGKCYISFILQKSVFYREISGE